MAASSRKFKIEFSKQSNGAANWEAGFLIQSFQDSKAWIWLKNNEKVTIRKGSVNESFLAKLDTREVLTCAGYKIRILFESESHRVKSSAPSNPSSSDKLASESSCSAVPEVRVVSSLPAAEEETNSTPFSQKAFLDPVLLRSMRSYQIEAAAFLLNRLQDGPCSLHPSIPASRLNSDLPLTGAILADDMGTGKTLVGLSAVWALCRHGLGKVRFQYVNASIQCSAIIFCKHNLNGMYDLSS
jgi:SNF2 family DNA or RNA helicase